MVWAKKYLSCPAFQLLVKTQSPWSSTEVSLLISAALVYRFYSTQTLGGRHSIPNCFQQRLWVKFVATFTWLLLVQGETEFSILHLTFHQSGGIHHCSYHTIVQLSPSKSRKCISAVSASTFRMPYAMPQKAKQWKDKMSAILLPEFVMWITGTSPIRMQCMLFPPLQDISAASIAHPCPNSVDVFDNDLIVNYHVGKLLGDNLILSISKKELLGKQFFIS